MRAFDNVTNFNKVFRFIFYKNSYIYSAIACVSLCGCSACFRHHLGLRNFVRVKDLFKLYVLHIVGKLAKLAQKLIKTIPFDKSCSVITVRETAKVRPLDLSPNRLFF